MFAPVREYGPARSAQRDKWAGLPELHAALLSKLHGHLRPDGQRMYDLHRRVGHQVRHGLPDLHRGRQTFVQVHQAAPVALPCRRRPAHRAQWEEVVVAVGAAVEAAVVADAEGSSQS